MIKDIKYVFEYYGLDVHTEVRRYGATVLLGRRGRMLMDTNWLRYNDAYKNYPFNINGVKMNLVRLIKLNLGLNTPGEYKYF